MDFPGFNLKWEILWTRSMMRGPGGTLGSTVSQAVARTRGTTTPRRHVVRGRSWSPVLTDGGWGGRGRRGRAHEGLTRARVVAKRRRDKGEELQRLELGVRAKEVRESLGERGGGALVAGGPRGFI
jgi:hypothetical protein